MKTKTIKTIMCLAIIVALLPVAAFAQPTKQAQAKTVKPTITITRAASGKVTIKNGSTYKLKAKATNNAKLTYKTSKKSVCKVTSKGKLIAKKCGKATITIKAKKLSKVTTKKIKVKVVKKSKYKKVKKISASLKYTDLTVGKTSKLKVTFEPESASNKNVTYKSSNEKVATVTPAGKIVAKKSGTTKIKVTSCDGTKTTSVKIRVSVCEHEWINHEPVMESHDILISPGILCKTCGQHFNSLDEWYEHNESDEVGLTHSYSIDNEVGFVYNLSSGYYECSKCGAKDCYWTIDENEWEQVEFYICSCGEYYYNLDDRVKHQKVFKCESYTKATGYRQKS